MTAAWRKGRVDAVVQSTDKNFMVPVGGAIVAAGSRDASLVAAVNKVPYSLYTCMPGPQSSGLYDSAPSSESVQQAAAAADERATCLGAFVQDGKHVSRSM